jgi:hypothetical protein
MWYFSSVTDPACLEQRICFRFAPKHGVQNMPENKGLTPVPGVFVGVNEAFWPLLETP